MERAARRFVALDLETTGTDSARDRIVEFCVLELDADLAVLGRWAERVDPGMPIPPAATAIHGIRDEDVRGLPKFNVHAPRMQQLIEHAIVIAYNAPFDLGFVHEELTRAGQAGLVVDHPSIDPLDLFRRAVPHTLEGAVRFYLGREHAPSHRAEADAVAAVDVLRAQRARHADLAGPLDALVPKRDVRWLDRGRRLYEDDAGVVRFGFGRHKGEPIAARLDYVTWMLQQDFPQEVRNVLQRALSDARSPTPAPRPDA